MEDRPANPADEPSNGYDAQRRLLLELDSIFNNASLGIIYTLNRVVQRCNPRAGEILGCLPEELIGLTGIEFFPDHEAYETFGYSADPILMAGGSFHREVQLKRRDGALIWCQVFAKVIDPDNALTGTIWMFDNAEADRQARSELEAIMGNAPVGIIFTQKRTIRRYNPRFGELLRLGKASWVGEPTRIFFESDEAFSALSEQASPRLSSGLPFQGEMNMRRRDGSLFAAEVIGYLIDAKDPPRGTIWIVTDISERTAFQRQLQTALGDLRAIMTNASVGILVTRRRRIIEYNPRFAEMFGISGKTGVGRQTRTLFRSKAECAALERLAAPLLAAARPVHAEAFMRRTDGTDLWIKLIGYVRNPGHDDQASVWILEDRTAYKQAEDRLRESHAELERRVAQRTQELEAANSRLRDFADAASDWLWEMGPDLRFTYFSQRIHKVLGTDTRHALGKTRQEFMHPDDIDDKWRAHFAVIEQHLPFRDFQYRMVTDDGSSRDVSISGKPIFDERNTFLGYRGIGRDISELKRAEREIEQKSTILQATLENMAQGISVFDARLQMTAFNRRFCELLDIPWEMASQGGCLADFVRYNAERGEYGPCDVEAKVREITELARSPHQYRRTRPNGRIIEIAGNPMPGGGFVATYTDVTEQQLAETALRDSEQELRSILDNASAVIFLKGRDGRYLRINRRFEEVFGVSSADVLGKTDFDLFPPGVAAGFAEHDRRVIESGQPIELENRVLHDGSTHTYLSVNFPLRRSSNELYAVGGIATDISERIRAEQDLRVAATMFESQEGMIVTDENERILRVNKAFSEITGYRADEVVGKTPRILTSGRHDRAFFQAMWSEILRTGTWSGEIWNRRKNGEIYPQLQSITAVRNPDGTVGNFVGTFIDITHRKRAEEEIRDLAFYDPLTRLPNRRLLVDRLDHVLSALKRSRKVGALMFIDLDNFKSLNDTRGHQVGDIFLIEVARRIQTTVRQDDTVARIGGDEFVIMIEDLDGGLPAAVTAEHIASKLLTTIARPYRLRQPNHDGSGSGDEFDYRCTASIGITLLTRDSRNVDDVLRQADLSMYRAKSSGRNAVRFFDPDMQAEALERVALENELRAAVYGTTMTMDFQPQISRSGDLVAVEGLLRWRHEGRGLVPPSEFIPLAEQTGMILTLGRHALEAACRQIVAWSADPARNRIAIAINVSAVQLQQDDFVDQVLSALKSTGAEPTRLKLEITESLLMANPASTAEKMRRLKAHGVGFSLDDFGTGYSSLAYLKHLPLDQIKIDRSFVVGLPADRSDAAICRTIIALSQSLGVDLVAEGVETAEQLDFLCRIGCDRVQGYLFSKPLPLTELEDFIDRHDPLDYFAYFPQGGPSSPATTDAAPPR